MKKSIKAIKALALIMAVIMTAALGLSACGSKSDTADDGQNPAMNFVGNYQCDRASIYIGAEGTDGMNATVTWASSVSENSAWTMSGTFDAETLMFEYHNCIKTNYVYDEDGEATSQEDVYTEGTGSMQFAEGDVLTLTWNDSQENAAEGMTFEFTGSTPDDGSVGLANPWSDADSLAEAAEGAGLEGFEIPEGEEISLGTVEASQCRYMEDMAEAEVEFPAVQMTIRKANAVDEFEGDISGDYNEYANEWTQDADGISVTCYGNRAGESTKTIWESEDGSLYSITAYGQGGDTDYGLPADDITTLVSGIK